jgi:hypothetical protein
MLPVPKNSLRNFMIVTAGASLAAPFFLAVFSFFAHSTAASPIPFPKEAHEGLDALYRGDPGIAIEIFRGMQSFHPDSPLGYLLEGEAQWWKIYCSTLDFKWNQIDAGHRDSAPEDEAYLRLAGKAIDLAESQLQQKESAELHLYAGMGYALRARLYGLRKENRATAHAGVKAREHFLRAKELDPQLADADTGLGLYNYYVDTLSGIARVLRVFMGIPAGNKEDGIRQLERAMNLGELTAVDARFYLSKNLRTYDQNYQRALEVLEPLTVQYPHNPIFTLLLGNFNALLARKDRAAALYHSAESMPVADADCKSRIASIAHKALDALTTPQK